jgi:hypothetical protein
MECIGLRWSRIIQCIMKMTTYKYTMVNHVVMKSPSFFEIFLKDSVVIHANVVKGTWSKQGTNYCVVAMTTPSIVSSKR